MAVLTVGHSGKDYTSIQDALDNTTDHDTVRIFADTPYILDATDQGDARIDLDFNCDFVTIEGCYTDAGDLDYGGAHYRDESKYPHIQAVGAGSDKAAFYLDASLQHAVLRIKNLKFSDLAAGEYPAIYYDNATIYYGLVIQNCIFDSDAELTDYLCFFAGRTPIVFIDCLFRGKIAKSCVAAFGTTSYTLTFANCRFQDFDASCTFADGGYIYASNVNVNAYHNILQYAPSEALPAYNAFIRSTVSTQLIHNVLYNAAPLTNDVAWGVAVSHLTFARNNIFVGLSGGDFYYYAGRYDTAYNCYYTCGTVQASALGCFYSNPLFTDAANGDFSLQSGSPCLNTGEPIMLPDGSVSRGSIGAWQEKQIINPPDAADFRDGETYFDGATITGTLDLPAEANVANGVVFDNGTKTGSYDVQWNDIYANGMNSLYQDDPNEAYG